VVGTASAATEGKPAPEVAKEEARPVPAAPEVAPKPEAQESGKTYTVAKGDNPYNIAKRFNTTQAALMKANNIDDPRKLQIGQKLTIP
jgi:LysM repeat protein